VGRGLGHAPGVARWADGAALAGEGSAAAWDLTVPELRAACAMKLYARFYGEWNDTRGGYRWQRLIDAARQCALPIPMNLHRAAADAELTRLLLHHMAEG